MVVTDDTSKKIRKKLSALFIVIENKIMDNPKYSTQFLQSIRLIIGEYITAMDI